LVHYPNGDEAYYITTAFRAVIIGGSHGSGDGELNELNYFSQSECESPTLSAPIRLIAKATFANATIPFFQPPGYSTLAQPREH
jgi:hypothetical protein